MIKDENHIITLYDSVYFGSDFFPPVYVSEGYKSPGNRTKRTNIS